MTRFDPTRTNASRDFRINEAAALDAARERRYAVLPSSWQEIQLENAADHEAELSKPCACGVILRDHYGARPDASGRLPWRPCSEVAR